MAANQTTFIEWRKQGEQDWQRSAIVGTNRVTVQTGGVGRFQFRAVNVSTNGVPSDPSNILDLHIPPAPEGLKAEATIELSIKFAPIKMNQRVFAQAAPQ